MPKELLSIHRFLSSQAFYPIALSTALAMFLYAGRIVQSDSWIVYRNLVWNLFLAWIPYLFSLLAVYLYQTQPHRWWRLLIPAGLWLLFFPNAPYIVTDFLHLQQRPFVPLWYDIMLLSLFAWTGIFLAITSLRTFQTLVKIYMGIWVSWVFVLAALGLSGLGIYLGRFERWNSWDMLIHPQDIIENIMGRFTDPLDNIRFFGFTILFTLFLFLCYWIFISGGEMKGLREK
jgi:uncharacterized membrane protein